LKPLLDSSEAELVANKMTVVNTVMDNVILNADANMVREVFENLISNAIKYGRQGGVIQINSGSFGDYVEFSVRNDGEGIPDDKLGDVFQKFTRLKSSDAVKRQKGTGLGLFITKYIIEAHGGTIKVASRLNEWTEFTFTLPPWK
jgi:signal transduction histidine kinase